MAQGFTKQDDLADNSVTNSKLRDSAALSVIGRSANSSGDPADISGASVGDVLQIISGPSLAFGPVSTAALEYDPALPATTYAKQERFRGGVEEETWAWGNQGSAAISYVMDGALLSVTTAGDSGPCCRWITPPAGSFTVTIQGSAEGPGTGANPMLGLGVLRAGTIATPTACTWYSLLDLTTGDAACRVWTATGYALTTAVHTLQFGRHFAATGRFYLQARYDAAADTILYAFSHGGWLWREQYSQGSVTADPVSVGFWARSNASEACKYFVERVVIRTDSAGLAGSVSG